MKPSIWLEQWHFEQLLQSLLPDFVLAFTFFTAIAYSVLTRRFERQRPTIAISVVIGLALALGLVGLEQQAGYSLSSLGPIAVGLAILFLAVVIHQAFKLAGGTLAGAGMAIGIVILSSWLLQTGWPVGEEIVQIVATVALILGLIALMTHRHASRSSGHISRPDAIGARQAAKRQPVHLDMGNLYDERHVSDKLLRGFRRLRKQADHPNEHPRETEDIQLQLKRMLPAEGWLTERLAKLRAQAYRVRQGHVAKIEAIRHAFGRMTTDQKKRASQELITAYHSLKLDERLERLDRSVAANEKRIRDLTQKSQQQSKRNDFRGLHDKLKEAEKLQKHNSRLFRLIEATEKKLAALARKVVSDKSEVNHA